MVKYAFRCCDSDMKERVRHFLSITDLSAEEIWQVFHIAKNLKAEFKSSGFNDPLLARRKMVMLFEKPSLRTKLSFDHGFYELGGHSVYFGPDEVGLGKRESASDIARVTASMTDMIVARVFRHQTLEEMAQVSKVPVINALSDFEHPCQALTDFFTIWEARNYQDLSGLTIGYVGDGDNNVTHSLCLGSAMINMEFRCASPNGFSMNIGISTLAKELGGAIIQTDDPRIVATDADVVVTDTWVSMGDQEGNRKQILMPYQVNRSLMELAKQSAIFMHCLPAHRGCEVTDEVMDGSQSVVFVEAENRKHVQKALMLYLLNPSAAQSILKQDLVLGLDKK